MAVRVSVIDLDDRIAVIRVTDDGYDAFPHVLRGTLVAMFADPTWHVVVAFEEAGPLRSEVRAVLDQAERWARDLRCRFTVTSLAEVSKVTGPVSQFGVYP